MHSPLQNFDAAEDMVSIFDVSRSGLFAPAAIP